MFNPNDSFETRVKQWQEFRCRLETAQDPIQTAIEHYSQAPWVSIHTDPYNRESWPNPWQLLKENCYCDFCNLLGIGYSLQLTERFSHEQFEIHIKRSTKKHHTYYLLYIGDRVVGYTGDTHVAKSELCPELDTQQKYILF